MSYYVMEADSGASRRFAFFNSEPSGYDLSDWLTGQPLDPLPKAAMTITSDSKKVAPLSDWVLSELDLPIFSPKLRELLSGLGVSNIQYVPVRLVDAPGGVDTQEYCAANVLGLVDCIDLKKARIERSKATGRIMQLEEFRLDPARIQPLPGMLAPPLVFRLQDYRILLIASEEVKEACQRQKMTGIKFSATTSF